MKLEAKYDKLYIIGKVLVWAIKMLVGNLIILRRVGTFGV